MATDPVSPDAFEPDDFWEAYKTKIIGYGTVILLAIGGWGAYEYKKQGEIAASQAAFAAAKGEDELRAVITRFPDTIAAGNATLKLAEALRSTGKYDEATTVLREYASKDTSYPLITGVWISLASTAELQDKPDEAIALYREIASKYPQSSETPYALSALGRLLAANGAIADAIRTYEDLTVRYPDSLFAGEARHELQILQQQLPVATAPAPSATPAGE